MIIFENSIYLWLLLLLVPLLFLLKRQRSELESIFNKEVLKKVHVRSGGVSKKVRNLLMIVSLFFIIIALARPQIDKGEIQIKSSFINVITAIDMSKSMFADDVYPNRFEFAKKKFFESLEYFKNAQVALIGFSSQPFLISPLTQDFYSLKFLGQNLNLDYLTLKGTDILATLSAANEMFAQEKKKIVLLFTDGGDGSDFSKEIAYAKAHDMVVYIYNIGTEKGGIIKDENGVLKDKNGDIVVVKRTDAIKALAMETGGGYINYSLAKEDIKLLVETIQNTFKATEEENSTIKDKKELFYYPLAFSIILFMMALFSLPKLTPRRREA